MLAAKEALHVDLVHVLGARGPRRKPAVPRDDLQAADGRAVARGVGDAGQDRLARQLGRGNPIGRERRENLFLGHVRRSLQALVDGAAVAGLKPLVDVAGVLARHGRDLGGQEVQQEAVLVRGPHPAVPAQEGRAGALLAAEAARPGQQVVHEPPLAEAQGVISEDYKQKYQKALPYLEQVVEKDPKNAQIWELLGKVYSVLGMNDDANNAFKKADELR